MIIRTKQQNSSGIFAIHGGGNIGLGLMADVVSKSPWPYRIVATSNDKFIKKIVNSTHQLWIKHKSAQNQTHINNVTIISRNFDDIVNLYKEASILAICLTPEALNNSIKAVAMGLIERYRLAQQPLKILVLMNTPDCATLVKDQVNNELNMLLQDISEAEEINNMVQYIPTVADRIVTKIPEQDVRNQLKKQLLSVMTIDFVDDNWLNRQIDALLENREKLALVISRMNFKLNLFNAEKNFALYAPRSPEISQFPAIACVNDISQIEAVKNKFINGSHAILAWLGALFGCKTIAEAIRLPGIKRFIETMMDEEIAPVLMKAYPGLQPAELEFQKKLFLKRCEDSIDDSVFRVGRDPLRKINQGERIRGTIELAKQQTPFVLCPGLYYGIAAAILYALKKCDPSNPDCKKIIEVYENNYLCQDVLTWSGETGNINFTGFDPAQDSGIINIIIQCISTLEQQCKNLKKDSDFVFEKKPYKSSTEYLLKNHFKTSSMTRTHNSSSRTTMPSKMINSPYQDRILMRHFLSSDMQHKKIHGTGIVLDPETGHLFYSHKFQPLELNFELVFVRHGETYGNCGQSTADGRIDEHLVMRDIKNKNYRIFQGNIDAGINQLTETGQRQAREVAQLLKCNYLANGWIPDVIYHSPLRRAQETGLPFVKRYHFDKIYLPLDGIREMSFGSWENRRVCDFELDDPCHSFYLNQNALIKDTECDYSECFYEVLFRAHTVLSELNQKHPGGRIILFSHSMFGAACCILTGKGQKFENDEYLAFDGKRSNGEYYTMPHAMPFILGNNFKMSPDMAGLNKLNHLPAKNFR